MTNANKEQIEKSILINEEIFSILGITHCICWGKQVYNHIRSSKNTKMVSEEIVYKKGFAKCDLKLNGLPIKLLKVFHPSMPGFGISSESTYEIIRSFLK